MRWTASASWAMGASSASTATRIASISRTARMRHRSSSSSTGRRAGATRRSSRSMRSSPSWSNARFRRSRRWCSRAATLHRFADLRFAVYPKHGGRTPELDDPDTLEWLGRFIGRIHAVGALAPFAHRPALDIATFGDEPRAVPAGARFRAAGPARRVPDRVARWRSTVCATASTRAGDVHDAAAARRLPREQRAVDRRWPAFRRLRRRAHGSGHAGPVDAAVRRSRRDDAPAFRRARRLRRLRGHSTAASCIWSRRCARCASFTMPRGSRGAGTTRRFPRRFPGSTRSATGRTAFSNCASRSPLMDEPPLA